MTTETNDPVIILIFGTNCTGKSTVGRALAELLSKCAFIEVDALRYMVVGGLVAYSAGIHPSKAPEDYRQQCWMGVENAVRLAQGFAVHGFSSVIEGLEDDCQPGTGWIEQTFGALTVCTVALICDENILTKRWQERGGGSRLPKPILDSLRWHQTNQSLFDCVVDTTHSLPEHNAEIIYQRCLGKRLK